ncbi:MAG: aspartate-semialdehyde dehydrogenase [Alphaproteobacteria bacterium]|nr:aspartate-semialdehyde dehydrogenase [Alphaproteobacteria bacterium]
MKSKRIIVVGATGRVGREMLSILHEICIPRENISAAASSRSQGKFLDYGNEKIEVKNLDDIDFSNYDIALFSAGSAVSEKYAPIAANAGCFVIDNTSFFRMHKNIPLIVPEINFSDLKNYDSRIIANPNCSTIQMVMALKPLHDCFSLKEIVVSTYQAVSGAGQKGVDELLEQIHDLANNNAPKHNHFKKQIAFNLIPQIDSFSDLDYTKEEWKMINETKKILGINDLIITSTCVRVPVFAGHAVSVLAKFEKNIDINQAIEALNNFDGVKVIDDIRNYEFATPIDSEGKNEVFVSRIRKHPNLDNALNFWCVADNLRKGAALNAIQIAERL